MSNSCDEIESEYEQSHSIYAIEDNYESYNEDKQSIINQFKQSSDNKIELLLIENKNKFNRLRLLLYQKFLNIIYAIISINIRRSFKFFISQTELFKFNKIGLNYKNENKVKLYLK